ncbi:MAG: hypothetical protein ACFB03_02480 [Paracoccaceae bacterium]
MTEAGFTGWAELDALQALARGAQLALMRKPLEDLTCALNLGGYKFCIATPEPDGYRILAVIAGGDLNAAPEGFLDTKIGPGDPILWESYRSTTPVSWTPYFADAHLMDLSGVNSLAERGVTSGASIPILSRHQTCRASLCVSGANAEAPGSLDLRLPAFWPLLRLAGLALFEAGIAEAAQRNGGTLTPSEIVVLAALSEGLRIKEVALKLGKSERTIRNQLESARLRIGAATTIEAVVRWKQSSTLM